MKTRAQTLFAVTSMLACLASQGCDETSNNVPTEQEYDDVAKSFGTLVVAGGSGGDVSSIHDALALSVGVVPFGLSLDVTGEIHGNRVGLDYAYTLACDDASGAPLDVCDDATDSARVTVDWSGALSIPPAFMAAVTRTGVWRLSDIQSGTAVLDGESSFDFDATFMTDSVSRAYHFTYAAEYDHVLVRAETPNVIGGSIRYAITASHRASNADGGHSSRAFDVDAVLSFDAEGHATVVLDGERTYDLELSSGKVTLHVES